MKTVKFDPSFNVLDEDEKKLLAKSLPLIEKFIERSPKVSKVKHHTRDAHAKTYAVLEGTLKMKADLPFEVVRVLKEQEYTVTARISNANLHIPPQGDFPAYGFALKLKNVEGTDTNLPLANFPIFPVSSPVDFLPFFNQLNRFYIAKSKNLLLSFLRMPFLALSALPFLKAFFSGSMLRNLGNFGKRAGNFILSHPFHSIGVYRFGDEMVKFRIMPVDIPATFDKDGSTHDAIRNFLQKNTFSAELQLSFCQNLRAHPVNNLLREWKEDNFFTIGTLEFDNKSLRETTSMEVEYLSFNPFENEIKLQPVGKIQQIRDEIYKTSVSTRRRLNGGL